MNQLTWLRAKKCESSSCVMVAHVGDSAGTVLVRDTKTGVVLGFTGEEFAAFLAGAKAGDFDPPQVTA